MAVERQARQEGVREHQIEVLGGEVGLPQAHDPGVGDRQRGDPAGQAAAAVVEVEGIEAHLEHAAVRAQLRRRAVQHRAVGKAWIEEPQVGQASRVGVHGEVVAHRIAWPAHPTFDREL